MPTNTIADRLLAAAHAFIETEMERDPVPDAIARLCARREGKPVTKRDAQALMAEFPGLEVRVQRRLGWTEISWWAPSAYNSYPDAAAALRVLGVPESPDEGRYLIIAYADVRWPDVETLKSAHGAWAFSARDERNVERAKNATALADREAIERIAGLVDVINTAAGDLRAYLADAPEELVRAVAAELTVSLEKAS